MEKESGGVHTLLVLLLLPLAQVVPTGALAQPSSGQHQSLFKLALLWLMLALFHQPLALLVLVTKSHNLHVRKL